MLHEFPVETFPPPVSCCPCHDSCHDLYVATITMQPLLVQKFWTLCSYRQTVLQHGLKGLMLHEFPVKLSHLLFHVAHVIVHVMIDMSQQWQCSNYWTLCSYRQAVWDSIAPYMLPASSAVATIHSTIVHILPAVYCSNIVEGVGDKITTMLWYGV